MIHDPWHPLKCIFFFGAKNRSLFYADPIFRKSRLSKNTRERDIVYATFLVISKLDVCFDEADVERIILWCHLWGVALAFASRIRALKVCFHCFGKVFLWCCQRLQKDVKELPWAFQRFSLWLSVFFEDTQTASPSRFFSRLHLSSTPRSFLRKLFNRPSMKSSKCFKLLNHFIGKTFLFVILVQNPALSFSVNNVFQNRGKSSLLVLPISAKITGTALLNSPKVQFFYSMCHYT